MEARYMTAELKVFREVGMLHTLAIRYRPEQRNSRRSDNFRRPRQPVLRLSWDLPLLEYLVERASAALAKRMKEMRATSLGQNKSLRNRKLPLEGKDHVIEPRRSSAFIALGPREMRIAINSFPRVISDIRLRSRQPAAT